MPGGNIDLMVRPPPPPPTDPHEELRLSKIKVAIVISLFVEFN